MKYTYQNLPPKKPFELLDDGDYLAEVVGAEAKLSKGRKTAGSDVLALKLDVNGVEIEEELIFHSSTSWKIDQAVKCFNLADKEGDEVDLSPEAVKGCRGWVRIIKEKMTDKDGKDYILRNGQVGYKNRVAVYYTDKEKFPRRKIDVADVPAWMNK